MAFPAGEGLCSWLHSHAESDPDGVHMIGSTNRTHAETWQRVCSLAMGLQCHNVQPGDRVALLANTSADLLETILAVSACHAIFVPLNTRWTSAECRHALELTSATLIIHELQFSHLIPHEVEIARIVLGRSTPGTLHPYSTEDLITSHPESSGPCCGCGSDVAAIVFTSGTTGKAKGVSLSYSALIFQAEAKIKGHGYSKQDVYLHTAPVYHVGGLVSWLAMLKVGAQQAVMPKFSPEAFFRAAREHRATAFIAVPTMVIDLLNNPACTTMPAVQKILLGGGELQTAYFHWLSEVFPNARLWIAWGMTECASSITACEVYPQAPPQPSKWGVLVGKPPAGIEVQALRNGKLVLESAGQPESQHAVATGRGAAQGELVTRGSHLMTAYWGNPIATREAFHHGWFRTGDLGSIDAQGNIYLNGRLKDVIRSGSENVSAAEVERVLLQMPGIHAAVVIGTPHERLGEQVTVVLQAPETGGGLNTIQEFCRQKGLSPFKIPKRLHIWTGSFPANSSGKLLKSVIKDHVRREGQEQAVPRSKL